MNDAHAIERATLEMYRSYPFPQVDAAERRATLAYQICKYKFLGIEDALRDGRVLDVGCGTGRTMLLPRHYGTREYVGLDQSEASLTFAKKASVEDDYPGFRPVRASLFDMPFPDNTFDVVLSWGVLHVTPDPYRGLAEMVRVAKVGGFVAIYLYNPFTHWRHNIQRWRIIRRAGDDLHRRFEVAHRMYGRKPVDQMSPAEIASFFDRYCVPIESDHSYGQIMSWFDRLGLTFWGASPPLRFRDFLQYMRTLAELQSQFATDQISTSLLRHVASFARAARHLPGIKHRAAPFKRPGLLHRALWQAIMAWHGRQHGASHASSFCGRKR